MLGNLGEINLKLLRRNGLEVGRGTEGSEQRADRGGGRVGKGSRGGGKGRQGVRGGGQMVEPRIINCPLPCVIKLPQTI